MKAILVSLAAITAFVISTLTPAMGQNVTDTPLAHALDPINALLDAFEKYDIVALDEVTVPP